MFASARRRLSFDSKRERSKPVNAPPAAGPAEYYLSVPTYIPPVSFDGGIPSYPSQTSHGTGTNTPASSAPPSPQNEFNPYGDPWSTEQNQSIKVERTFSPGPERRRSGRYAAPAPSRSAGARKIGVSTPPNISSSSLNSASSGPSSRQQRVAMARAAVPAESFAESIARLNMSLAARTASLPPKQSGPMGRKAAAPSQWTIPNQIYFPPERKTTPPLQGAVPRNNGFAQAPSGARNSMAQTQIRAPGSISSRPTSLVGSRPQSAGVPRPRPESVAIPRPQRSTAPRPSSMVISQTNSPPRARAASFSSPTSSKPQLSSIVTSFPSHSLTWEIERPVAPKRSSPVSPVRKLSKTPSESQISGLNPSRRRQQSDASFNPYSLTGEQLVAEPKQEPSTSNDSSLTGPSTPSPQLQVLELHSSPSEKRKSFLGRMLRKKTDDESSKSKNGSETKEGPKAGPKEGVKEGPKEGVKEGSKEGSFHQLFGAWGNGNSGSPPISRNSTVSFASGTRSKRSSFFGSRRSSPTSQDAEGKNSTILTVLADHQTQNPNNQRKIPPRGHQRALSLSPVQPISVYDILSMDSSDSTCKEAKPHTDPRWEY